MPYQPAIGDRVTVTRTNPDGRVYRSTGTLTEVSAHGHGFALHKDDGTHGWYSDAATLLRCYGVVQTVELLPDDT